MDEFVLIAEVERLFGELEDNVNRIAHNQMDFQAFGRIRVIRDRIQDIKDTANNRRFEILKQKIQELNQIREEADLRRNREFREERERAARGPMLAVDMPRGPVPPVGIPPIEQLPRAPNAPILAVEPVDPELEALRRNEAARQQQIDRTIRLLEKRKLDNERKLQAAIRANDREANRLMALARDGQLTPDNVDLLVDRLATPSRENNTLEEIPDMDIDSPDYREKLLSRMAAMKLGAKMGEPGMLKCPTCLTNKVNRVLVPCGHFICSTCLAGLRIKRCGICSQAFSSAISIWLMKYLKYKQKYYLLKKKV